MFHLKNNNVVLFIFNIINCLFIIIILFYCINN